MIIDKYTKKFINILLILLIIYILTKISFMFVPIFKIIKVLITPFVVSIFLFYALKPITNKLSLYIKNKTVVSLITILSSIIILGLFIYFGGSKVKTQFVESFINPQIDLSSLQKKYGGTIAGISFEFDIISQIYNWIQQTFSKFNANTSGLFYGVSNLGTQIILTPLISYYLLKDEESFRRCLYNNLPIKHKSGLKDVVNEIEDILGIYIGGQLIVATIIGALMFLGYLILGVPSSFFLAIFAAIMSLIPILGPFVGTIPALLIALTIDLSMVIKIVVMTIVIQQVEGDLITPRIMGSKLALHPLTVILIILISVHLFGVLGAFVGIPLYRIIQVILKYFLDIKANEIINEKPKEDNTIKKDDKLIIK